MRGKAGQYFGTNFWDGRAPGITDRWPRAARASHIQGNGTSGRGSLSVQAAGADDYDSPICVALSINLETLRWLRKDLARRFAHRLDRHPGVASRVRQSTPSGRLLGCGPEPSYARTPVGPGWALVILVSVSPEVLAFQANLVDAVAPFVESGGTAAAFVTDPGETIIDWVEAYVPNQIGDGKYLPHITVGVAKFDDLNVIEAEPFDAFAVHPSSVSV
jgi:hypothetical protein